MSLYLHFIAFDFLHMAEFSHGKINAVHPMPKRCRVVQLTSPSLAWWNLKMSHNQVKSHKT